MCCAQIAISKSILFLICRDITFRLAIVFLAEIKASRSGTFLSSASDPSTWSGFWGLNALMFEFFSICYFLSQRSVPWSQIIIEPKVIRKRLLNLFFKTFRFMDLSIVTDGIRNPTWKILRDKTFRLDIPLMATFFAVRMQIHAHVSDITFCLNLRNI